MYSFQHYLSVVLFSSILGLLGACSSDSGTSETTEDVTVQFAAKVNGADFNCGQTYPNVGAGSHDYTVNDFRLFVHEAYVHDDASGNTYPVELTQDDVWQVDDMALLDFEDGCGTGTSETNTSLRGEVTLADDVDLTETGFCFTVGVPASLNHSDVNAAPSPLNDATMQWNWLAGYKFVRIDGIGDPNGVATGFNVHLGSQGCPAGTDGTAGPPTSACTVPNTFEVCVDAFNVTTDRIAIDVGSVLAGNDVSVNSPATAFGCMAFVGDEDCVEVMPRLGLDYSYGGATGTSTFTGGQVMFSVE